MNEPALQLLSRMRMGREHLQRRSRGSTRLVFEQVADGMSQEDTWWQVALPCLAGFCDTTDCCIYLQHIPQQLLSLAGEALPALRTLELGSPRENGLDSLVSAQLPPPTDLPSLRDLTVQRTAAGTHISLWTSVAPYLAQLISLTIAEQPASAGSPATQGPAWTSIFSSTHPTNTLTSLSVPAQLTPWLAALLQKAAPALDELWVLGISTETAGAAGVAPVCSWRTVHIADRGSIPYCAWTWLPLPDGGEKLLLECTAPRADIMEQRKSFNITLPIRAQVSQPCACTGIHSCADKTMASCTCIWTLLLRTYMGYRVCQPLTRMHFQAANVDGCCHVLTVVIAGGAEVPARACGRV